MGDKTYVRSISAEIRWLRRNQEAAFVHDLGTRFRSFDAAVGLTNQVQRRRPRGGAGARR